MTRKKKPLWILRFSIVEIGRITPDDKDSGLAEYVAEMIDIGPSENLTEARRRLSSILASFGVPLKDDAAERLRRELKRAKKMHDPWPFYPAKQHKRPPQDVGAGKTGKT